jgi:N-acetylglucosamine-6-phosphate deacetylase
MHASGARLLIRGAQRLLPNGKRADVDVLIEGGVIAAVGDVGTGGEQTAVLEAHGCLVAPGFVDIHVHGAGGDVFEGGSADGNRRISAELARHGTIGVMATVATLPADALRDAVAAIAAAHSRAPGARILGIHLEGPFLNPRRSGAQNPTWMRPPSIAEIDALQDIAGGLIRMVTVAPELDDALPFIAALRQRNIVVAMGHTEATSEQVEAAIAAGVSHVTHLFNAMSPLHHRTPGPIGVALTDDALSVEIICDGHHLHPRTVDMVLRCKPRHRVALVSDAVAAGMPDGMHELFGLHCEVRDGTVRTAAGQLAGSCLTLDVAVRNLRAWQPGRALGEILAYASTVPARIAGTPKSVALGADADVILLRDDMRVAATVVQGRCVWSDGESVMAQG